MEDRFTEPETGVYQRKIDLILGEIKLYRGSLKDSQNYNLSKAGFEEYQLGKLEQAFKDLEIFYANGKKA